MRIAPAELQVVQRAGMLTRFGLLGPVVFVMADLPESGTSGTGLDLDCLREHHGIVVQGTFTVHHADGRTEAFEQGDAFYVPPGPPAHTFTSAGRCVVEGFGPVPSDTDTSVSALDAIGFVAATPEAAPLPPPATVRLRGSVAPFQKTGAIDIEGSQMGDWLFVRARFGPRGGYTSGWCDQTHWGLVLDGEVAITYPDVTELASRGDVYLATPGHRFPVGGRRHHRGLHGSIRPGCDAHPQLATSGAAHGPVVRERTDTRTSKPIDPGDEPNRSGRVWHPH